jgi:6-pyruvoyltetrahydropterin/6-carboxytetrahydropterin synthase
MFRLTREVRFAINALPDDQLKHRPANSYGGFPSLTGFGLYLTAQVTLAGDLQAESQYLINIKEIDSLIRDYVEDVDQLVRTKGYGPAQVVLFLRSMCYDQWRDRFESVALALTPTLTISAVHKESPMMRLSQKFEFSASHRLHNPALTDAQNREAFGKCNNPLGHGHNYELQVTLAGEPNDSALLVDVPAFERTVTETVIDRLDHKNLNAEVPEFRDVIPSVENIARVIYRLLKPRFDGQRARLASVTVWETAKTWCEYSE